MNHVPCFKMLHSYPKNCSTRTLRYPQISIVPVVMKTCSAVNVMSSLEAEYELYVMTMSLRTHLSNVRTYFL